VIGLLLLACTSSAAQTGRVAPTDMTPQVVVSRREVRVIFPPQSRGPFRFNRTVSDGVVFWAINVPDTPGEMQFGGGVWGRYHDTVPNPITIPSLEALVRMRFLSVRHIRQHYGPGTDVGEYQVINGNRVTLVLKDSVFIDSLFNVRPPYVDALWSTPGDAAHRTVRVLVTYIAPQIPEPDSALRARHAQLVADFDRKYRSVERSIELLSVQTPYVRGDNTIQFQAGDSAMVSVREVVVENSGYGTLFEHRNWLVTDSLIAAVRHHEPPIQPNGVQNVVLGHSGHWVIARAAGRATIRAHNIAPYVGKPTRNVAPAELARDIMVIPRLTSLRVVPSMDTVSVNSDVPVRVEARDQNGNLVRGLKVSIRTPRSAEYMADSGTVTFREMGRQPLVVGFWAMRDTAWVFVRNK
jgi:hypothetical protein